MRSPLARYLVLFNASLFASSQELFESALVFQDAAVLQAERRGQGPLAEALITRAGILAKRGLRDRALAQLADAQQRVRALPEGDLRRYHQAQIDVLSMELSGKATSERDVDAFKKAIGFFAATEPGMLPRLDLSLGRLQWRRQQFEETGSAFERGISSLEDQQSGLGDEALRMSYFDDAWSLYPEMIRFELDVRGDLDSAFAYRSDPGRACCRRHRRRAGFD